MTADKKSIPSFDEIIEADRRKRQNEALANEILGKKRNATDLGSKSVNQRDAAANTALGRRIGVPKTQRSSSIPSRISKSSTQLNHRSSSSSRLGNRPSREDRMLASLNSNNAQVNKRGDEISIKGAGRSPCVLEGRNFAPGTTAADIKSAFESVVGGEILGCRITSQQPIVIAEIVCPDREVAENVIAHFHNRKADGRILSVHLKTKSTPTIADSNAYDLSREQADSQRRANRRAEPWIQDGTYGFDQSGGEIGRRHSRGRGPRLGQEGNGLYSDELMADAPPLHANNQRRGRGAAK
ncbi:hypothetical protein VTN49DRAFT_138 [Thermomyces lanuginosus]|uniref:uncharacterized protein n=1 Tax=Thermomyces lanuginosus TaxID=5541 RepID=UPI0037431284